MGIRTGRIVLGVALLAAALTSPPSAADPPLLLEVVSTRPDLVTGGDALVRVSGPVSGVTLDVDGRDVTDRLRAGGPGVLTGVVGGLRNGDNVLTARTPGGLAALLVVTSHPIIGPVISGPHQTPFGCETVASGLGAPLDADCSVTPAVAWYYRDRSAQFQPLTDPYAPYPADTATTRTNATATTCCRRRPS